MSDLAERLRASTNYDDRSDAADLIEAQAARIAALEAALQDMAKHVWRGDWNQLKPETRALLGETK